MKLIIISDTHGEYKKLINLPKGDVLIYAGDISTYGEKIEFKDFNVWLGKQGHKHKIVIAGNHDKYLSTVGEFEIGNLLSNCTYLENDGVEINGVKFWGSPITPTFLNWYFMADRGEEIRKYWDLIPDDTNVLITHGPAYGILDKVDPRYGEGSIGCEELWERIKKLEKLKLHCFGHIHGSYGFYKREGLQFINASLMNEDYELVNKPIEVEI